MTEKSDMERTLDSFFNNPAFVARDEYLEIAINNSKEFLLLDESNRNPIQNLRIISGANSRATLVKLMGAVYAAASMWENHGEYQRAIDELSTSVEREAERLGQINKSFYAQAQIYANKLKKMKR